MSNPWTNYKFDHTFSDLAKFDKYFVGAEKFLARVQETADLLANSATNSTYPPFNLKKTEENKYVIEMAVAGFAKQDIELTLDGNKLKINSNSAVDASPQTEYIHKGISERPFTRTFTLADNVVVDNCQLVNGMLRIWLEHVIPEDRKPKKLEIKE